MEVTPAELRIATQSAVILSVRETIICLSIKPEIRCRPQKLSALAIHQFSDGSCHFCWVGGPRSTSLASYSAVIGLICSFLFSGLAGHMRSLESFEWLPTPTPAFLCRHHTIAGVPSPQGQSAHAAPSAANAIAVAFVALRMETRITPSRVPPQSRPVPPRRLHSNRTSSVPPAASCALSQAQTWALRLLSLECTSWLIVTCLTAPWLSRRLSVITASLTRCTPSVCIRRALTKWSFYTRVVL